MEHLISVIVPIYKVEKFLEKCIDSIINQTYKNLEIILVDDGSPDSCPNICDEYKIKDDRIIVIHKVNGGLSDARNAGIDIAKGEYFIFVDSDDFLELNMIEELYKTIIKDKTDLVACNYNVLDENYNFLYEKKVLNNGDSVIKTGLQAFEDIYSRPNNFHVVAWNKLYKSRLFNDLRYPKGKIHEDEFLIHHILFDCEEVSIIENPLLNHLVRSGSIMTTDNRYQKFDSIESRLDRMEFCIDKKISSCFHYVFLELISFYLLYHLRMDNSLNKKNKFKDIKLAMKIFYNEIKGELSIKTKLRFNVLDILVFKNRIKMIMKILIRYDKWRNNEN